MNKILDKYWSYFKTIPFKEVFFYKNPQPRYWDFAKFVDANKYNDKIFLSYSKTKWFTETKSLEKFNKFVEAWFNCLGIEYSIIYGKPTNIESFECHPNYFYAKNDEINKELRKLKLKKF